MKPVDTKKRFAFQVAPGRSQAERAVQIAAVLRSDPARGWTMEELRAADSSLPTAKRLLCLTRRIAAEGAFHAWIDEDRPSAPLVVSLQPPKEGPAVEASEEGRRYAVTPASGRARPVRPVLHKDLMHGPVGPKWARRVRRWVEGVPAEARRSGAAAIEARGRKESAA